MGLNWQDLAKRADEESAIPPEGKTSLECTSAGWQVSSTGKRMIKAVYRIDEGPARGQHVTSFHVVSPENDTAMRLFARTIQSHGIDLASVQSDEDVVKRMPGAHVTGVITHEEWNGEMRAQLGSLSQSGDAGSGGGEAIAEGGGGTARMFQ